MPLNRIFLGWDKPCLHLAAEYLAAKKEFLSNKKLLNLGSITVVFSGGRAGRRLIEILAGIAEKSNRVLVPPRILTVGRFPEALYTPDRPVVEGWLRVLLWAETLRNATPSEIQAILPNCPSKTEIISWSVLARQIDSIYTEISGAQLSFGDVAKVVESLPDIRDDNRWQSLQELLKKYQEKLFAGGFLDLHQARLNALKADSFKSETQFIFIGAADINNVVRKFMDRISESVTVLIHAPEGKEELFDSYGCILPKEWNNQDIPLGDDQICVASSSEDQASALLSFLRKNQKYPASQITVGVADDEIVPFISRALEQAGISIRNASGTSLRNTSVYTFLSALSLFLSSGSVADFGSLLRHSEFGAWLKQQVAVSDKDLSGKIVSFFDNWQAQHLQARLTRNLPGTTAERQALNLIIEAVENLLAECRGKARSFSDWQGVFLSLLGKVFGGKALNKFSNGDRIFLEASKLIADAIHQVSLTPACFASSISASEAIRLILDEVSDASIKPEPGTEAVELLGWLELQMDDAACLAVTGFNEGKVPESVNEHPFLPNSLRAKLGLLDNERRYARDAYALTAMIHSKENLLLISGRKNPAGEPLSPSRLMLACPEKEIAERILSFYSSEAKKGKKSSKTKPDCVWSIPPAPIPPSEPISEMSVTSFKDYLTCPYRFYLKHVLKLENQTDREYEMNPLLFGSLAHEVLSVFDGSPVALSVKEDEILAVLEEKLDEVFKRQFGDNSLPAVIIQKEQLRLRFKSFASWQAEWRSQGWVIRHCEYVIKPEKFKIPLKENLGQMRIKGRIDRIDYNPRTNTWMVFDYKTGDSLDDPRKTHQSRDGWIDLQLPLYWHFLKEQVEGGVIETGYIAIEANPEKIGFRSAKWTDLEYKSALEAASEVATKVRKGIFEPMVELPESIDPFAWICGTGQLVMEESAEDGLGVENL